MEEVEFEFNELDATRPLFSRRIEDDPWVLYHATSSLVEREIEAQGFGGICPLVSVEDILQLTSLYRRINWCGIHGDGYPALATFTMGRAGFQGPRTWFRETSMRSLVYAERDFAGGEWAMTFRKAFADILTFLRSEEVQKEHLQRQTLECKELVERGGAPSRVIRVDAAQVAEALELLRKRALNF